MSGRVNTYTGCIVLSLLLGTSPARSQLLKDTAALNLVTRNIDYIYNLRFNEAADVYKKICSLYPESPYVHLIRGMTTYLEHYPLLYTDSARISFEEDMRESIRLSETDDKASNDAEYLLTDLCARGLLMMFYSDNDLIMEVLPLASGTYKYLKLSFNYAIYNPDLYYFTGIYNYYREAFPREYPVYEPIALLFHHGDMVRGIKELGIAARKSVVMKAESYYLLAWIYLYYENKYPEALSYCKTLHELYPDNNQFLAIYIKNLLLMKYYDDAEKLIISSSKESGNRYYQGQLDIFNGILQEKKYHDNSMAQKYYQKGLSDLSFFGTFGSEYAAYAYFGMSRISDAKGEKHNQKIYRKEAVKLADFKKINFDD